VTIRAHNFEKSLRLFGCQESDCGCPSSSPPLRSSHTGGCGIRSDVAPVHGKLKSASQDRISIFNRSIGERTARSLGDLTPQSGHPLIDVERRQPAEGYLSNQGGDVSLRMKPIVGPRLQFNPAFGFVELKKVLFQKIRRCSFYSRLCLTPACAGRLRLRISRRVPGVWSP
jgi:hypothetical protein